MRTFNPEGHTAQAFDVELNDVKHKVMIMGGLVESMAVSYTHLEPTRPY